MREVLETFVVYEKGGGVCQPGIYMLGAAGAWPLLRAEERAIADHCGWMAINVFGGLSAQRSAPAYSVFFTLPHSELSAYKKGN